jgi:hypothetical protein
VEQRQRARPPGTAGQLSAELLRYAKGTVEVDPVVLHMDVDDELLARITNY